MKPDANTNNTTEIKSTKRIWPKLLLFTVIIVIWYALLQVTPLDKWLLEVLSRIEQYGFWGPCIFILIYIPSCVLMFPDVLPNAAAGAIWGAGLGAAVASIGRLLGSTITFLLARRFSKRWQEQRMASDPKFAALSKAIEREGFRIVILLRLCPLFPVIMLNYGLGMTRVRLRSYMVGTLIGMIPRSLLVAYSGSGVRAVADIASGNGMQGAGNPVIFWGGLVLSLVIVVFLANKARRLINDATA